MTTTIDAPPATRDVNPDSKPVYPLPSSGFFSYSFPFLSYSLHSPFILFLTNQINARLKNVLKLR